MNDMEKQKFDQAWKDAFDQAEVSPSKDLWTNIELGLEKASASKMKRTLLFYKLTAAASIVFAMCVTGASVYYYNAVMVNQADPLATIQSNSSQKISGGNNITNTPEANVQENTENLNEDNVKFDSNSGFSSRQSKQESPEIRDDGIAGYQPQNKRHQSQDKKGNQLPAFSGRKKIMADPVYVAGGEMKNDKGLRDESDRSISTMVEADVQLKKNSTSSTGVLLAGTSLMQEGTEARSIQLQVNDRKLPSLTSPKKIKIAFLEPDPVAIMMAKLEKRERELMDEGEKRQLKKTERRGSINEKLWTSVGFAAGAFNPVNQNSSSTSASNSFASNGVSANQSKASGTSYSLGMNVGTKLSGRWVLQGGVNYLSQNSSYEANSIVRNNADLNLQAASVNSISSKSSQFQNSKLVPTVPYNVDNNVRFMSVPVQAGYVIVNHALGVQINGGVSTDLFLQNTITPQSSNAPKVTQSNGDNSPYRSVNFSGLVGTEITYRFSRHYRLALNPGLRYPLNSIYKSDIGVRANPLTFDVGIKFRYIFH